MSTKTYLQNQIRLVTLSGYDLFTEEENDLYMKIIELGNELDKLYDANAPDEEKQPLLDEKKKKKDELESLIKTHFGRPRTVRIKAVAYGDSVKGITWHNLKTTRRIAEFSCELSRAMGLETNEATLDLIVIKWKNIEELRQLVIDGFYMPILKDDGSVENRHYRFYTASAGQLRRDKFQAISDEAWERCRRRIECGLSWEEINKRGGCNVNKVSAYMALPGSATEEWTEFDIDKVIVVDDFEGDVTDRLEFIKPDYTTEIGIKTVKIKHTDGCGMMLPSVSMSNFMFRMPWCKGLLISFDYLKFCAVHGIDRPVLKDIYGVEHDLIKEDIKIIMFKSMFKMYKYYDSWDHYKKCFKENDCRAGRTNYEEEYVSNKTISYQFIQSLVDMTDDEIKKFTEKEHKRIKGLTRNKEAMLKTLGAEKDSEIPYKAALFEYPELLRESYSRESLKDIRKKMLLDAKSGKLKCDNKRLYACPDLYGVCEWLFLGDEHPKGLIKNGYVACKILRWQQKADVLRSPHLSFEHAVRKIIQDYEVYEWFYTNGIYLSNHDLISRILQLDVDGDQLNVVTDPVFVEVAERNAKEFDFVPLYYDAGTAEPEIVSLETMFNGLKRAHDFSSGGITSIGEISNMLTRVWNKDVPDRHVTKLLCYFNNLVIDAAKSGKINHYKNYPKIARRIGKATGGKRGLMPAWFAYSKNARKSKKPTNERKYTEPNNSTMNRICKAFEDIGNINMNFAGIAPFNWQMLLSEPCVDNIPDIPELFCKLDNKIIPNEIISQNQDYASEKQLVNGMQILAEDITAVFEEKYGSLEYVYPYIVKYLFGGEGMKRPAHKQMFWKVFGHIALRNIRTNLFECSECTKCGMKIPSWVKKHVCIKNTQGFFECIDCQKLCERTNSRQCRCPDCQEEHRLLQKRINSKGAREKKKEMDQERYMRLGLSLTET